jgi:hypothetical protein
MEKAVADFIASEMQDWASEFITARKRQLTRSKVISTGELVNSLDFEVDKQAKQDCIACLLAFEEHGRWVDMKTKRPDDFGLPYIQALEKWIVARGWESKFTDAYKKNRNLRKTPVHVLNNIAWAIAVKNKGVKKRYKNWYRNPKAAAIEGLFDAILAGLPPVVGKRVKDELD